MANGGFCSNWKNDKEKLYRFVCGKKEENKEEKKKKIFVSG
jgi:hypothetical protein